MSSPIPSPGLNPSCDPSLFSSGTRHPSAGPSVDALLVGQVEPLGHHPAKGEVTSGINKHIVDTGQFAGRNGFTTDAQADLDKHGGPDKAIHHYPFQHYDYWRTILGDQHPRLQQPGAIGENISSTVMDEDNVFLGDIYRIGEARVQVSQGRQPCWKLDIRFDHRGMSRAVQQTYLTGWYYRVLEPGMVSPGDPIILLERPCPRWSVRRTLSVLFRDFPDGTDAAQIRAWTEEMLSFDYLSDRWRITLTERLRAD